MIPVSTGGAAPFMAAAIRDRVSDAVRGCGQWVEAAARFRSAVRGKITDPELKKGLYQRLISCIRGSPPAAFPASSQLADRLAYLENAEATK